jgi:BMFP domain-containing protein YqiC
MLEKTSMGEREFEGALAAEIFHLRKEIEKLRQRVAELEGQLAWTEGELARRM